MKRFAAVMVGLSMVLGAGCRSTIAELPVRSDFEPGTAFHEWHTFRFAQEQIEREGGQHPRFEDLTKRALQKQLEQRGYRRITSGTPDFRVAFALSFRGEKVPSVTPDSSRAEPTARAYSDVRSSGSLTVQMLDPASSKPLWSGRISDIRLPAVETGKEIENIVWRVLAEFPPITE